MWKSRILLKLLYRGDDIIPSENNMFAMWISDDNNHIIEYCMQRLHEFANLKGKKLYIIR